MTRRGLLAAGLCAAAALAAPVYGAARRKKLSTTMIEAARQFLSTLDADQRALAQLPFNDEERFNWHYVPKPRRGLPLGQMSEAQQTAALALLRAGLSAKGFSKAATIRQLELVLKEMENGSPVRNPDHYYFTIFGDPSPGAVWGWRYEGHHCSQNWTVVAGDAIASSPQFFGSNPGEVLSGPLKGTRVLAAEEDLARALLHSLDDAQKTEAVLSPTAPDDIITGHLRKAGMLEDRGIPYSRLTKEHQGILLALIEEYATAQAPELAAQRLEKVRKAGLADVKFAWMGGPDRGQPHYYRVQGATFLIEYDNTQNNANHAHSVWRDFEGDFGVDLLAHHYEHSPHHAGTG